MDRKNHQNEETNPVSFKLGFTGYECLKQTFSKHIFCSREKNEQQLEETVREGHSDG
jgi:hypothetical protein